MDELLYDVAIIGAGPGGCACALALRNSGLKVALIDKDAFPRDKVCGDAIPPEAFSAMDEINSEWGKQLRALPSATQVFSTVIYSPGRKRILKKREGFAANINRSDFDQFLFTLVKNETATDILQHHRLVQLELSGKGVDCLLTNDVRITASIVIGCDGANSVVSRNLAAFGGSARTAATAVRAHVHGITGLQEGTNEIHVFDKLRAGYLWIFPLDKGWANIGFSQLLHTRHTVNNQRETMQQIIREHPAIAERFSDVDFTDGIRGFAVPLGTHKKRISGNRFMLCGDAAALVQPVGGNGIGNAMWSGIFAGQQAIDCFRSSDFSDAYMKRFDQRVYKKIGKDLRRNAFLLRILQSFPRLVNWLPVLNRYPKTAERLFLFFRI